MRFEGWIFIMVVSKPKKPAGNLHWQWWRKRKKKKRLYVVKGKLQYHGDERQHLRYEGGSGIWGQGHTVGPNGETPVGNWIKKNLWNWLIILMPATVWHILNVKTIHLPDTEMCKVSLKKSWNHIKQTELNICLAGFNHLKPLQVRDHGFQFLNCEGAGRAMGFRLLIWSTKGSFSLSFVKWYYICGYEKSYAGVKKLLHCALQCKGTSTKMASIDRNATMAFSTT